MPQMAANDVHVQMPTGTRNGQEKLPFETAYFATLILDIVLAAVGFLWMAGALLFGFEDQDGHEGVDENDISSVKWIFSVAIGIATVIWLIVQYFAWKGYLHYRSRCVHVFVGYKVFLTLSSIRRTIEMPSMIVALFINVVTGWIAFKFAKQLELEQQVTLVKDEML